MSGMSQKDAMKGANSNGFCVGAVEGGNLGEGGNISKGFNPDEAANSNGPCGGAVDAIVEAVNPDAGVIVLDGDETMAAVQIEGADSDGVVGANLILLMEEVSVGATHGTNDGAMNGQQKKSMKKQSMLLKMMIKEKTPLMHT